MLSFCTLFDSNYYTRGLALYESLKTHCSDFHLYIFAFDDICYSLLRNKNLSNVTVISLNEFEDQDLLNIKPVRSTAEYCWTCTPSTVLYVIDHYHVDLCTYIDADICFFSSPYDLLREMGDSSVMITEHRYTKEYDKAKVSGIYCVQFISFRNNSFGREALNWWRSACLDSCELNEAEGKCGDQKYLDDWPTRFQGVHVLRHLGGGVAPWNVQQYTVHSINDRLVVNEKKTARSEALIFYHFHSLKFINNDYIQLSSGYELVKNIRDRVYKPYLKQLKSVADHVPDSLHAVKTHGCQYLGKVHLFVRRAWLILILIGALRSILSFFHMKRVSPMKVWDCYGIYAYQKVIRS